MLVFCVTKDGILPEPLAARPMEGLLFVQLNTVVVVKLPVKFTGVVLSPLHQVWLGTVLTVGFGFTVIVNVRGVPGQLTPLFE